MQGAEGGGMPRGDPQPPMYAGETIDWTRTAEQPGDPDPLPFSFLNQTSTGWRPPAQQVSCYGTRTTEATEALVAASVTEGRGARFEVLRPLPQQNPLPPSLPCSPTSKHQFPSLSFLMLPVTIPPLSILSFFPLVTLPLAPLPPHQPAPLPLPFISSAPLLVLLPRRLGPQVERLCPQGPSGASASGQAEPRYCPSLESKWRRFPGRTHQVGGSALVRSPCTCLKDEKDTLLVPFPTVGYVQRRGRDRKEV